MAKPYRNTQFSWISLVPLVVLVPFVVVMTAIENAWWVGLIVYPPCLRVRHVLDAQHPGRTR